MLRLRSLMLVAMVWVVACLDVHADDPPRPVDFGREILPILSDHCFLCHGPDAGSRKADLRLDLKEIALRADDPVIVPGKSDESEVILRVTSPDPDQVMPPPKSNHKLTPAQIELLTRWIDEGAAWGKHWAFEPVRAVPPPSTRRQDWSRNAIDPFVLARLETEGLAPSPEADKVALIRRLSLDLIGLPPTIEEVDAFVADTRPDAYERLVDRLLANPNYGERMVWEWLEAARYADTNGYQGDSDRTMWPWRDWAVDAMNANMPYDRFTVEQVAGDLLPGATVEQKLATGFERNHPINGEGGRIAEENRVDYVMDMAETTGTVWLGLTFNCCRCHDHKYDPLKQTDYYSLFAFFNQTPVTGGGGDGQTPPVVEVGSHAQAAYLQVHETNLKLASEAVDQHERRVFPRVGDEPISASAAARDLPPGIVEILKIASNKRDRGQIEVLENHWKASDPGYSAALKVLRTVVELRSAYKPSFARVMVMEDLPQPRDSFVLDRGSYERPTTKVQPDVPGMLPPLPADAPRNRLALAKWLVASENPLTARVTVNRAWQQFFGIGLVKTAEDFGIQGERPSHPELLDALADDFVRSGWDVKALHRKIVTSATYRQSSRTSPALLERDPQNRLLARGPRFRLPPWMIRDQALAASGLLVNRIGGPPVKPYQPSGVWEEATFGTKKYQQDKGDALYRRSLYTFWRRIVGPTEFFDSPARSTCVVKPTRTNTPLHALTTLNDTTYVEAARALAQRVLKTSPPSTNDRIEKAFRLVLARKPTEAELRVLADGFERSKSEFAADRASAEKFLAIGESPRDPSLDLLDHAAMAAVCSTILNLDESLTKE